jgi:acyl CoA:acetate/3-ketoacid CoA transferase beta subunit
MAESTQPDARATAAAIEYSPREMMAIAAGRFIKDGDVLFAGTGVAMLAATVAKRIHAPHAHIFFETGGIGPLLDELPMAVARRSATSPTGACTPSPSSAPRRSTATAT